MRKGLLCVGTGLLLILDGILRIVTLGVVKLGVTVLYDVVEE